MTIVTAYYSFAHHSSHPFMIHAIFRYVFSAPGQLLESMPGTLMLTDCLEACQSNDTCGSVNYETGLCVLFSSNADKLPGKRCGRCTCVCVGEYLTHTHTLTHFVPSCAYHTFHVVEFASQEDCRLRTAYSQERTNRKNGAK